MESVYIGRSNCCGCTACANICPTAAITMKPDSLGFMYPEIDQAKCIDCQLCVKVCSFHAEYSTANNMPYPLAYGVRHNNEEEVKTSRSGAAFIAISDWVLGLGGVVYGVSLQPDFKVSHIRVDNKTLLQSLKGSKYVQSNLDGIFLQVKKDLKDGKVVLFSGTPCQTSGLNSFLPDSIKKKLLLVDIVCHGVPSPHIFNDFVEYIQTKYHNKIISFNFRDKARYGWASHEESFILADNNKRYTKIFTSLFYQHIMLRPSCGVCPYTNFQRPSDLTIADFWGWQNSAAAFPDDNMGVSLLLVNTQQGKDVFESIKEKIIFYQVSLNDCLQPNLQEPSVLSFKSNQFEKDYVRFGFRYVLYRYVCTPKYINLIKTIVKRIIHIGRLK